MPLILSHQVLVPNGHFVPGEGCCLATDYPKESQVAPHTLPRTKQPTRLKICGSDGWMRGSDSESEVLLGVWHRGRQGNPEITGTRASVCSEGQTGLMKNISLTLWIIQEELQASWNDATPTR